MSLLDNMLLIFGLRFQQTVILNGVRLTQFDKEPWQENLFNTMLQLSYQSLSCCVNHVLCMFIQDKRAYLNDHIEASVEEHLELTWSSLVVAKQELDNMKDLQQNFYEIQEVNQKLTESMAASREEIRDLTLTVKSLEIENIQLKKWMEDMTRKMESRILTESMADTRKEVLHLKLAMQNLIEMQNVQQKKSMEDMGRKMAKEKPTESDLYFRNEVRDLKLAIKNLEMQNTRQKTTMEGMAGKMASGMKSLDIQMDQVSKAMLVLLSGQCGPAMP